MEIDSFGIDVGIGIVKNVRMCFGVQASGGIAHPPWKRYSSWILDVNYGIIVPNSPKIWYAEQFGKILVNLKTALRIILLFVLIISIESSLILIRDLTKKFGTLNKIFLWTRQKILFLKQDTL